jgi:hypothetical protein
MTIATVSEATPLPRTGRLALSFDAFLMAASLAVCAALFAQGGLEAFVFAIGGGVIGARRALRGAPRGVYSGALPACSSARCSPHSSTAPWPEWSRF